MKKIYVKKGYSKADTRNPHLLSFMNSIALRYLCSNKSICIAFPLYENIIIVFRDRFVKGL